MQSGQNGTNFTVFRVPRGEGVRPAPEARPVPASNMRTENLVMPVPPPTAPVAPNVGPEPSARQFTPLHGALNAGAAMGGAMSATVSLASESAATTLSSGGGPAPDRGSNRESGGMHTSQTSESESGVNDYDESNLNWMKSGRVLRIKETGESYRFPLSPENLPRANITSEISHHLRATLEESIQRAIKMGAVTWMENPCMSPLNSKHQWKVHQQKKDSAMYRRKADGMLQRNFLMRSKFECSMDDLMMSLLNLNTEDERTFLAHSYREEFLDGSIVAVLEEPTIEDPYHLFAIKWCAFQTPMDSMFAARDMMFAEFSRTIVDKGQRYVARIIQSIKDCNITERRLHFVRNEMWSVQLFRSLPGSNDKRVDMTMSGTISFPSDSSTPTYIGNRFLTSLFTMSSSQVYAADAKYIVNNNLVSQKTWVPNNERSCCNVCFKSFGFLRSRHHCRICAEIMCTNCMMELSLRTSKLPPMLRPEGCLVSPEKFCYNCIVKGREKRGSMMLQIMQRNGEGEIEDDRGSESQQASSTCSSNSPPSVKNLGWSAKVIHQQQDLPRYDLSAQDAGVRSRTATASRDNRHDSDGGAFQPHSLPSELGAMDENGYYQDGGYAAPPGYAAQPGYAVPPPAYGAVPAGYAAPPPAGYAAPPPVGYAPAPVQAPAPVGYGMPAGFAAGAPSPPAPQGVPGTPGLLGQVQESIAAQQALLRSMMMEGQRMMGQQARGGVQPSPRVNGNVVESPDSDMIKLVPAETSIEALD